MPGVWARGGALGMSVWPWLQRSPWGRKREGNGILRGDWEDAPLVKGMIHVSLGDWVGWENLRWLERGRLGMAALAVGELGLGASPQDAWEGKRDFSDSRGIWLEQLKVQWPRYCCWVASVVSDSLRPHRRQPTRLPRPWHSPGKNTGVGCHFLLHCVKVKSESEGDHYQALIWRDRC